MRRAAANGNGNANASGNGGVKPWAAALGLGVAIGLVALLFFYSGVGRSDPAAASQAQKGPSAAAVAATEARVGELERTAVANAEAIRRLESSLAMAERRADSAHREAEKARELLEDFLAAASFDLPAAGRASGLGAAASATLGSGAPGASAAPAPGGAAAPVEVSGAPLAVNDPRREEIRSVMEQVRADEEKQRDERRQQRDRERITREIERLTPKLNLTGDQQQQILALRTARDDAMRTLMRQGREEGFEGMDRQAMQAKFEESRTAYETQLQTILSPIQYQALVQDRAEQQAAREAERGGVPGVPGAVAPAGGEGGGGRGRGGFGGGRGGFGFGGGGI